MLLISEQPCQMMFYHPECIFIVKIMLHLIHTIQAFPADSIQSFGDMIIVFLRINLVSYSGVITQVHSV